MKFKSDIEVQAGLKDSSGSNGTSGQILSSNGSTVSWIAQGSSIASDVQNLVKAGVAINKGQAVYVTGADGTNIIVGLASNTSEATSSKTLGLLNATVAINGMADVVQIGRLAGLNTIGAIVGDPVWLGTNGNLIYGLTNKPYAPAHLVFIGIVTRVNSNNGEIFVNVQNGFELNEIHDVDLKTTVPVNGDILGYNGTLWVNKTIAEWLGYTPANANGTVNYVSKFTSATSLGDSQIFDNGTNVGIGTASPNSYPYGEKLSVNGNISIGGTKIGFGTTDSFVAYGWYSAAHYGMSWAGNNPLALSGYYGLGFFTNGSEKMRVTPSGEVGIGTTSPAERLSVSGAIISTGGITGHGANRTSLSQEGSNGAYWQSYGADASTVGTFNLRQATSDFSTNRTALHINSSGNVGIGTAAFSYPSAGRTILGLNGSTSSLIELQVGGTTNGYINNTSDKLEISTNNFLALLSGSTERMRITNSGNVGIGTSNPGFATTGRTVLTLNGPTSALMEFQNGGIFKSYLFQGPGGFEIYDISNIQFSVNGGERMRVASNGNVGINTTAPIHKLSVNGKIGGDVWPAGYIEFLATTETVISAESNVVLGYAQNVVVDNEGSVGVGTIAPETCAAVEIKSITQGFLPPRMRTGERDSIGSPVAGLMIFNTDDEVVQVYTNGSGWRTLAFL